MRENAKRTQFRLKTNSNTILCYKKDSLFENKPTRFCFKNANQNRVCLYEFHKVGFVQKALNRICSHTKKLNLFCLNMSNTRFVLQKQQTRFGLAKFNQIGFV